ncbi:MAG TPA: non-ribosomal peptide synthetase, partial [Firmicutes bacterium]|nr:non-ribosomal peptide synthetase [Bacillota bacterium]
KGVKPDDRVAIMVSRSAEIMIGALAIMKAGGAYLPVDPDYPAERIRYMLADSGAQVLLSQGHLKNKAEGFSGVWLDLDDEGLYAGEGTEIDSINKPSDLAYVIYTSGSTGKPKGVMIEHRNLINLCCSHNLSYNLTDADNSAAYIAFGFDGSVVSMFPPLAVGACLHIIPEEIRLLLDELNRYFEDNRITITVLPTQFAEQFVELVDNKSLKALVTGGEKLKVYNHRHYLLVNEYGPTENTVDATAFPVDKSYANIPIGKPRHNVWAYVVDKQGCAQPVGVPGELWLGGAQVARGYLNRPELTAEKFVANPFAAGEENARVYKTGDLVRWLPDGNLEFLGRIDQQVKIRGYRIELGEIEQQLLQHPGITEAVVLDCDEAGGAKFLCAYAVVAAELEDGALKAFLGRELPDYMIPAYFIWLDRIPMTVNGKVDKRALREMSKDFSARTEYVAPRNEAEEKMAAIWREVLDVEQVGIDDDFFSLGGHSLKATRLAAVVQKSFGVRMPITELFQQPTVRQLCQAVAGMLKSAYPDIVPVPASGYYPLSSAQKRMFVMAQMEDIGTTYNIAGAYIITGPLDKERLRAAVDRLAARHDILRTAIVVVDGQPMQQIMDVKIELDFRRCALDKLSGLLHSFVQKFALAHAPLLRLALAELGKDQHALLYNAHHIIFDGLSMEIFLKELLSLYAGEELPELKLQYRDYAVWQNHLLASEIMAEQEQYWLDVFSGELPVLNLPFDFPRPPVQRHEGRSLVLRLDRGMLANVQAVAEKNQATLFMVLLAAYNILLSKYCGQDDIVVGTPASGRTHPDLAGLIGMFVGTLPVRSQPAGDKTFSQFLGEVKQLTLAALHNQDYPFEKLVEKLKIKRDASRNPLFDVMFTFSQQDNPASANDVLSAGRYDAERVSAHLDLALEAQQDARGIELLFEYATSLFTESTVKRLGEHYVNILRAVAEDPTVKLGDIEISSPEEKQQVLTDLNDNRLTCPAYTTYQEMFVQAARSYPEKSALVFKNEVYTYRELDARTNQLARVLRAKGVKPDDR